MLSTSTLVTAVKLKNQEVEEFLDCGQGGGFGGNLVLEPVSWYFYLRLFH